MAEQRIIAGGKIEVPTAEELAEVFRTPYERVILSMGGADSIEEVHNDIPVKGFRSIATTWRRGGGSDNFVVPAAQFVQLCDFRPGRIAGTIQNIGTANPAFAYLAPLTDIQRRGAQGTINGVIVGYMAPNGGGFDFKISNECWGGPVTVYSTGGTTLCWGEH